MCDQQSSYSVWRVSPPSDYFTKKRRKYLLNTRNMLVKIHSRPPLMNCFGLHEWAMLYRSSMNNNNVNQGIHSSEFQPVKLSKFQQLPLRVSDEVIAEVVEKSTLRCTHYDAFRFFTSDSKPLNTISPPPKRDTVAQNDQPGCIHVTMDLFK